MNILLIGGTGVISTAVSNYCANLGYNVFIINRGKTKKNIGKNINIIRADIRKESIDQIKTKINFVKFDVVVDFLTLNVEQLKKTLSFLDCKQYIFISSATIYTENILGHRYREYDDKNNLDWDYCKNKIECEQYLMSKENKLLYTIVRPYVTYDSYRIPNQMLLKNYYSIIDRIIKGLPIVIFGNDIKCTVTSSEDFAVGLVGLFNNKKAFYKDFHITSDVYTTWDSIINLLARKLNKTANIVNIPVEFVESIDPNHTAIDVNQIVLDKSRNMIFDNKKIKEAVPEYNSYSKIEDNIDNIVNLYKDNENKNIDFLWNGCLDRLIYNYSGEKIKINEYKINNRKNYIKYMIGRSFMLYNFYRTSRAFLKFLYNKYKRIRGIQ